MDKETKATFATFIGVAAALYALAAMAGCATTSADTARKVLTDTTQALSAAEKSFLEYDKSHQATILSSDIAQGHPEKAHAELVAYRVKQDKVVKAFIDAKAVVVLGEPLIDLADKGAVKQKDLDEWITNVIAVLKQVRNSLSPIGIGL